MTATSCLDFIFYGRMEKTLEVVGKKDLYDFLGKPPNTSVDELLGIAKAEYSKITMSNKMNTMTVALKEVIAGIMLIFKDINKKKYYDIYLATKNIWDNIASLRKSGTSELSAKDFSTYFENAKNALKQFSLADADVKNLLNEGLNFFRIAVMVAGGGAGDVIVAKPVAAVSKPVAVAVVPKPVSPEVAEWFKKGMDAFNIQNFAEAIEWLRKAAERGHAGAQNVMGISYRLGYGVQQDYAKAADWFRKAAAQGFEQAQKFLDELKKEGSI